MTRALQTIPQEPEADTSAEIYLTGAYFLLPFGSVLLLGLVALRVPGAQILAVAWYIFFLSFGPALFAVWCLYTCGAYDADALNDARRRALFERYNRLDVALYRNATAIWCAEWYNAIGDRESCVRTYAHARPGTPSPCTRDAVAAMA